MDGLGNYRILQTLSQRGTTSVYLAEHRRLGRKTVLKVHRGGDAALVTRFEREARIVADLAGEAVVAIYDFGESEGCFYISLEYVEGWNLSEYLRSHTLSDAEVIELAQRIARSVAGIHARGYLHRDLKPENILVSREGKVKITDFGLAWHSSFNHLTAEGQLLGTPLYMSPEQINNLPFTLSSDVFALGIIFYQIATGVHPFEAPQYGEIFAKILSHQPAPVQQFRPNLPAWFAELVARLMHKEADKRPQNAGEILALIESNLSTTVGEANAQATLSPTPPRSGSRRWQQGLAYSLLLLALFFGYKLWQWQTAKDATADPTAAVQPQPQAPEPPTTGANHHTQQQIAGATQPPPPAGAKTGTSHEETQSKALITPLSHQAELLPEASLFIKTWPWCEVFLNGNHWQTTPMTAAVKLAAGRYLLTLQNPAYPAWSDSITLQAGEARELAFQLDSLFFELEVQVSPWAEIFVDGEYRGTTPLTAPLRLTRQRHLLQAVNRYYQSWQDTIDGRRGGKRIKHITLQALP